MSREAHVQFWESAEVKSLRATRLWQYGTPGGMTVFDFRMSRKREGPLNFLGNFEGLLQTDGYAAYDRVGGPKMVHAACWSHYLVMGFIWSCDRGPEP